MNPRRGVGIDDDVLMADLLIWDKDAIALIDRGKRELSVGYDADYEELGPGHGRQRNIRANHLALVERGRCGPRCAIGDSELVGLSECDLQQRTTEDGAMPAPAKKSSLSEKIRAAFRARDDAEKALDLALRDEDPDEKDKTKDEEKENGNGASGVHVHLHNGGNGNGAAEPADEGGVTLDPAQLETAVSTIHALEEQLIQQGAEMDEVWDAIGRGTDSVADSYPHRDARRARDAKRGRDEFPPKKKDDDDDTKDDLPGAPGGSENRAILTGFQLEAPPGTKFNDVARVRDSAIFQDSFNETLALAEVLVPGIKLPTYDRAAPPKRTYDAMCAFRRRVLDAAWAHPETREIIDDLEGGRFNGASGMTCDAAKRLFIGAAKIKARSNRAQVRNTADLVFGGGVAGTGPLQTPTDLQAVLNKHYERGQPR
jgi:hypothetical protein